VGKYLPLGISLDNDVGGSNCLVLTATVLAIASASSAQHASPRQPNGRLRGTCGEERPVRILIRGFTAPLGKQVQAVVDRNIVTAPHVPRRSGRSGTGASSIDKCQVLDSQ
jgi:hypothetical protein